jgi:PAS domain S-box-containing protein
MSTGEENRSYRSLIENSSDAIVVHDLEGKILYANPAAIALVGDKSLEEAMQKSVFVHLPKDIAEIGRRDSRKLLEGQSLPPLIAPFFLANGDRIEVEVHANFVNFEGHPAIQVHIRDITRCKHVDEILRERLEMERALINSPIDMEILLDANGTILNINDNYAGMLGKSPRDLLGVHIWDVMPPDAAASQKEYFHKAMLSKQTVRFEEKRGDKWYDSYVNPIVSSQETVIQLAITSRDITERKRIEEALRESEENYRALVEMSPDAILIHQEGKIVYANPVAIQLSGSANPDGLIGGDIFDFIHPDFHERVQQNIQNAVKGMTTPPTEMQIIQKDGTLAMYEGRGKRLFYRGIPSIQVVLRDISERKKIEASLRESEEKYRTLVEMSPDAIVIQRNDLIVYANPATARLFRVSNPDDLVGMAGLNLIHPDSHSVILDNARKDFEGVLTPPTEFQVTRGDGTLATFEGMGRKLLYNGEPAIQVIFRDVTERKQAEDQLKEYSKTLKQSNEDLVLFAAIASHDLQEPIRTIVTYAQLLRTECRERPCPSLEKHLQIIENAGLRMNALVDNLRQYSNVRDKMVLKQADMEKILKSALNNLQVRIQDTRAAITHDPLPTVLADGTQIIQVFQNLIDNAIKFRKEGTTPKIHISASPAGDMWEFAVRDNGIGIPSQYFEKIFVLFEHLHRRDAYPGTGLGLALCKKIIERHGGRIWVESAEGEGATFFFTLKGWNGFPG